MSQIRINDITLAPNGYDLTNKKVMVHDLTAPLTANTKLLDFSVIASTLGIPSQAGNSGKFLTTNGTVAAWTSLGINSLLPSQTGNSGKVLVTNGTNVSWQGISSSGLADGTYGDIIVSSAGAVWSIDDNTISTSKVVDNAITYGKIQQVTANKLLGNVSGSTANVAEIAYGNTFQYSGGLFNVANDSSTQKVEVLNNGTLVGTRKSVNFIVSNITHSIVDNSANNRIDVTLTGLQSSLEIRNNGTLIGSEPALNFIAGTGISLTIADAPGSSRVNVTIAASGAQIPSQTGHGGQFLTTNGTTLSWATTSSALTFENGLTSSSNVVKLGGALTGDTDIDLTAILRFASGNYDFVFNQNDITSTFDDGAGNITTFTLTNNLLTNTIETSASTSSTMISQNGTDVILHANLTSGTAYNRVDVSSSSIVLQAYDGAVSKYLTFDSTGTVKIDTLAGSGNRMVIASANGTLSTQAITNYDISDKASGQTVGAVTANIGVISTSSDTTGTVEVNVVASTSDNKSIHIVMYFGYTNNAGTVTIDSTQKPLTYVDAALAGADITPTVSGTSINLQVTGVAATTIDWKTIYKAQVI